MKCEDCGKNEVSFHFTSNVNGYATERHLCAECAGKLGFNDKPPVRPEMSFEEIFTELFGGRPDRRIPGGYGMVIPTFIIPTIGLLVPNEGRFAPGTELPAGSPAVPEEVRPEIDEDMKKRREINILREQMKTAAEEENYEKAAALRDSIRRLESGNL